MKTFKVSGQYRMSRMGVEYFGQVHSVTGLGSQESADSLAMDRAKDNAFNIVIEEMDSQETPAKP